MSNLIRWLQPGDYGLARLALEKSVGALFLIGFLNALNQFKPLLGERGLLPVPLFVRAVPVKESPSLFFLFPNDTAFTLCSWAGIALSAAVISGIFENNGWDRNGWILLAIWAAIWVLYLSFVNVGQIFYGFGWESILLEAGFYAIFLGSSRVAPQMTAVFLLRWLCFRVMFGAGLIKLRGDPCWQDMTCLDYHYETQPMPNALSWFFFQAPVWTHRAGVWFNHFAELIAPFGYFCPQPVASIAAVITIVFQSLIFASGNLSWLNVLTIVLAVPALDARVLAAIVPLSPPQLQAPAMVHRVLVTALAVLVVWLSVKPVQNMISPQQVMNTTYNPLHLVGTYGAFGGITRTRYEVVVEGTRDESLSPATQWREYEFRGKPND